MFFITTVRLSPDSFLDDHAWTSSCHGYYADVDVAFRAVLENWGDIQEYYYEYAVIEYVPEGIYSSSGDDPQYWFKWDTDCKGWVPCEAPEPFKRTIGWFGSPNWD